MSGRAYIRLTVRRQAARNQHGLCADGMIITGACELDHMLALADGGTDDVENLWYRRPAAHLAKTVRENKARAKAKRIAKKRNGWRKYPKRAWPSRPIENRGFDRRFRRTFHGTSERRTS